MNRRSFLMGVLAAVAAWLLPKRLGKTSAVALVEEIPLFLFRGVTIPEGAQIESVRLKVFPYDIDFPVAGLDEPRAEFIAFEDGGKIDYTLDGGYTWQTEEAEEFETTDIWAVLRELTDREGWTRKS